MTHLDMDQLLALAEAASEGLGFDEKQVEELEHLKECEECYEQFCLLSVLHDATDPAGGYVFARPQEMAAPILAKEFSGEEALQPNKTVREKVLAAVRVFCRKIGSRGGYEGWNCGNKRYFAAGRI